MERLKNWLNVHSNPVNVPKALCSSERGWASGSSVVASSLLACECQGKYHAQAVCLAFQLHDQLWKSKVIHCIYWASLLAFLTHANQSRCSSINPAFHQCPRRPVQMQPFVEASCVVNSVGSLPFHEVALIFSCADPSRVFHNQCFEKADTWAKCYLLSRWGWSLRLINKAFCLTLAFPHQEMLWNFHRYPRLLPLQQLWLGSWLEAFYHVLRSNGRPNEPPTAIRHEEKKSQTSALQIWHVQL